MRRRSHALAATGAPIAHRQANDCLRRGRAAQPRVRSKRDPQQRALRSSRRYAVRLRAIRSVPATGYRVAMDSGMPGATRPIDVIIADDHTVVRDGIRAVLEREDGEFRVVAEAADIPSMVREVREHRPDLLTLDLTMP